MSERLFLAGKFTDLSDPRQLGRLTDLLNQLLAVYNSFDQNSFALAWIEGAAAGQVIVAMGVGNAPEWSASPTLTGAIFSGLTASQLVVTDASKALASTNNPSLSGLTVTGLTASQMVQTSAAKALVSVAPTGTYTPTNVTPDRSFDADTVVIAELADVVGTLIADLQAQKVIG